MNLIRKKEENEKIIKSKEIIKREKQKIKLEKKKQKQEKRNNLTKYYKKEPQDQEVFSLKEQIISMIYFEIIGAVLCLLILFALSGGRNFIKLYSDLQKLINVYDTITKNYYGEINKDELVDSAIETMINSVGDTYTTYTDSETKNQLLEDLAGTYEGIGCSVSMTMDGEIIIANIFENSPASIAGLAINDIITKIDDQDFTNKTSEEMATYIKSSKTKTIKLTIKRAEEEKELTITRKKVEIPTVTSKIIEENDTKIGYIDISIFSSVTYKQFKENLEKLENDSIEALIIDVRSDTGGYLNSVTDISELFLKKGQTIYQLQDNKETTKIKDKTKTHRTYPIAVMINSASASASEILASAIKESYGGLVIGTTSYGKGTVQKTNLLPDGSMIKYTTQNWLTPNGNWINEIGVEPTINIEVDTSGELDNQLEVAITELIKKLEDN